MRSKLSNRQSLHLRRRDNRHHHPHFRVYRRLRRDRPADRQFTYDAAGNLLTVSDGSETHTYTYGDESWKDLLTAYDGHAGPSW